MNSDAEDVATMEAGCTLPNKATAKEVVIPEASKERYLTVHENFIAWRARNGDNGFSETVLLNYFRELSTINKPTTLKMIFSMLATTVFTKENTDIKQYPELKSFMVKVGQGYQCKKCKVLTEDNIKQFINDAPDIKYLVTKVALILGIKGTCRSVELYNLTTSDFEMRENSVKVTLRNATPDGDRVFFLRNEELFIVKKYHKLRIQRGNSKTDRFFLIYKKGRCLYLPLGLNKLQFMPRAIARYLNLPNPNRYTGNCFRTSSLYITRHQMRVKAEVFLKDQVVKKRDIPRKNQRRILNEKSFTGSTYKEASSDKIQETLKQEKNIYSGITTHDTTEPNADISSLSETKLVLLKLERKYLELDLKHREIKLNESTKQHEFNEKMRKKQLMLIDLKIQNMNKGRVHQQMVKF